MAKLLALLDSNVVIASIAEAHEHHDASIALFRSFPPQTFAVAAHSYAEAYSILTRASATSPFRRSPADSIAALESVAASCLLVGLTHGETFAAIQEFAGEGGAGPRLYDKLIGQTAAANGIETIITWNLKHMSSLFKSSEVTDPVSFVRKRS